MTTFVFHFQRRCLKVALVTRDGAKRAMDVVVACNRGEAALAELIGPERAKHHFDQLRAVAACSRRASTNRRLLDMRLD